MAGKSLEARRTDAATEKANSFLVDDVDLLPDSHAAADFANSKKRRPCRSESALPQRKHRRSEGRGAESPQHRRQRFPVPRNARREKGRRDSRVASIFSQ